MCSKFIGFFALCSTFMVNALEPIYVANYTDSAIYRVDPITGASTLVTPIGIGVPPGAAGADGVKLASPTLAYTVGFNDGYVYSVNLETGDFSRVSTPQMSVNPLNLTLKNSEVAYVANAGNSSIYSVNLITSSCEILTTIAGAPVLEGIALKDGIAYVAALGSPSLFAVDLADGTYTALNPIPGDVNGLTGIAIWNNTAYVVDGYSGSNILFAYDLVTGNSTPLTTLPGTNIFDLAIVNGGSIAYTASGDDNLVYAIDLQNFTVSLVTPNPVGTIALNGGLFGVGVFPTIYTQGLLGNILTFTNYLNANASLSTLNLFNFLSGSALENALKAAMPARLGFATFAAQNGYLASTQVFTDHLYQKRFARRLDSNRIAALNFSQNDLLACACETKCVNVGTPSKREGASSVWLAGFGEYAQEQAQRQTPAFNLSLGGAVVGWDYNCVEGNVIGLGGSYAYTHLHEKEGMGSANVNQGFLGAYSLLHASKWYFDLGVWGGYYHTDNQRKIAFTFYDETAKSNTHGWQLAPHFEVGYDGYLNNDSQARDTRFAFEPFLLADWVASWESGFSEHGAADLNMHQERKFCSLFRGELGLRFYEIISFDSGLLVFQEKGSYAYQKAFNTGSVTASLVGSPGTFTVTTLVGALNLGVAEFSVQYKPFDLSHPYVALRYQGEFGSGYLSHQGIFEIGKDF